jgi:uncharacterized protein (UPF0128 family)
MPTGARIKKMTYFETAMSNKLKELPNGKRMGEHLRIRNANCPTKFTILDNSLMQFRLVKHPPALILKFYDREEDNETDNIKGV